MRPIEVCAGLVRREKHYLLATRPSGTHLAGKWEVPGGKCLTGEDLDDCIVRELREELGIETVPLRELRTIEHRYPEKTIRLHFMLCELAAESPPPTAHEEQDFRWFLPEEILSLDLADADRCFFEDFIQGTFPK